MDRRDFLQAFAAGGLVLTLPGWLPASVDADAALARPDMLARMGDDVVLGVGRAYRGARPREDSPDVLARLLAEGIPARADVRRSLLQQVRRDFERGRTLRLEGWILSETEARQCALYSLLVS